MYDRIRRLLDALSVDLFERDEPIRLGVLAAVAGESLFLLGPPGVGKSLVARRLQQALRDARSFSYLMGRFSTPDEVFGPLSIRTLREHDRYERNTEHYLPDAEVVFLDEIWKASPPIQNALLTALNERLYRNGTQEVRLPLKIFVGASNELPSDRDETAAFWDRFLIRLVLDPISGSEAFERLLTNTSDVYRQVVSPEDRLSDSELSALEEQLAAVTLPPRVLGIMADIRVALAAGDPGRDRSAGDPGEAAPVYVSDRRWKKIARLLRASAVLHGRAEVEPLDCALIAPCAWSTPDERLRVEEVVTAGIARRAGEPERAAAAAAAIERIREEHRHGSSVVVERTEETPVFERDEYLRLEPAEVVTLVWHGDFTDLPVGRPAEADLFRYDSEGNLMDSVRAAVTRTGAWELDADGTRYRVRTTERTVARAEVRELPAGERSVLGAELERLLADLDAGIDEITSRRAELLDTAAPHLFVGSAAAAAVAAALEETALRMSEVRVHALDLAASL